MAWPRLSNYYPETTTSQACTDMSRNTYLHAISAPVARHLGIKGTVNLHHSQLHPVPGKASPVISLSTSHCLMGTTPFSYLSIDSQKCLTSSPATKPPQPLNSLTCSSITSFAFMAFQTPSYRTADLYSPLSSGQPYPNPLTLRKGYPHPFTHRPTDRLNA